MYFWCNKPLYYISFLHFIVPVVNPDWLISTIDGKKNYVFCTAISHKFFIALCNKTQKIGGGTKEVKGFNHQLIVQVYSCFSRREK